MTTIGCQKRPQNRLKISARASQSACKHLFNNIKKGNNMATCGYCSTTILFGGKRDGTTKFCNDKCLQQGQLVSIASAIPSDVIKRYTDDVHQGSCPRCDGPGPVDVHISYRVWSAAVVTSWSSRPAVSCNSCGTKRKLSDALFSLLLGWWGLPWGFLITPVQIVRNLIGLVRKSSPDQPSPALEKMVRLNIARQAEGH